MNQRSIGSQNQKSTACPYSIVRGPDIFYNSLDSVLFVFNGRSLCVVNAVTRNTEVLAVRHKATLLYFIRGRASSNVVIKDLTDVFSLVKCYEYIQNSLFNS